jgi:hypothetical protein
MIDAFKDEPAAPPAEEKTGGGTVDVPSDRQ